MEFSEFIKTKRAELKLSRKKFADLVGASNPSTIWRWEKGIHTPKQESLVRAFIERL